MLAFGGAVLGWRRTAIFAVASLAISLASELLGTRTGLPFGAYEYTDLLGPKVLGRVPVAIPLSWFAVGLASYLLALRAAQRLAPRAGAWLAVGIGAWLLLVWDLVLDPAMAHESLPVKFWVWHRSGPYFGMPLQNFVGWGLTGAVFMAASRAAWGDQPDPARVPAAFPLAMYALNLAFAVALSISVGLWIPPLLAAALGLVPLLWTLAAPSTDPLPPTAPAERRAHAR
jgi:putative membrane protein